MPQCTYGSQRTACKNCFSPSTKCVLGIELKVVRFGSKHLYMVSHLAGPKLNPFVFLAVFWEGSDFSTSSSWLAVPCSYCLFCVYRGHGGHGILPHCALLCVSLSIHVTGCLVRCTVQLWGKVYANSLFNWVAFCLCMCVVCVHTCAHARGSM